jgi:hypothetical protein
VSRNSETVETGRASGAHWLKVLDSFEVRFVALDLQSDRGLVAFLLSQPGWVVDCRDKESVLFARASDVQERDGRVGSCAGETHRTVQTVCTFAPFVIE